MRPPDYLLKRGIHELPCIGDGRQSGTSGSPSILNASPEAANGGGLALLQTGDRVRIDLRKRTADILVSDEELAPRREALAEAGGYALPGEPDSVAGDPARARRRAVARHGAEAGRQVPAHRRDQGRAAGQPLVRPASGTRTTRSRTTAKRSGESIERVARLGYDAIELVGEPDQYDAQRVRELAEDAGIVVSSISSMYTADRDLCHPDPEMRRTAIDYVRAVADLAAATGAATIIVAPSAVMKTAPLAPPADEWSWAVQSIRAGGEYAASVGVDVALEPWNRYETYFLNRLEQAIELWHAVGLENGGVMARHVPHEHRGGVHPRCPATAKGC